MALLTHQFGSTAFQPSLKGLLLFELKSLVGRIVTRARAPSRPYINIGSGTDVSDVFENLDFYFSGPRNGPAAIVGHDLRRRLPYADGSFSGAYSEHALEHLFPNHANQLLREIHRILKPGSIFRCAVPDLQKYVDFYLGKLVDPEFGKFESGREAIWALTQNWGHLSVWDSPSLIQALLDAGFNSAVSRQYREGGNANLLVDRHDRKWETLYVEGVR
jgi:SAM-dependent methyltransferase